MFHAKSLNLGKYDYKIILENLSKLNQSELSDCSPDFRTGWLKELEYFTPDSVFFEFTGKGAGDRIQKENHSSSLSSGSINHLTGTKDFVSSKRISNSFFFDNINFTAENPFQLFFHIRRKMSTEKIVRNSKNDKRTVKKEKFFSYFTR
jgi:hypothetical protein